MAPPVVALMVMAAMAAVVATTLVLLPVQADIEPVGHLAGVQSESDDSWQLVRGPSGAHRSDIQWRGEPGARYAINGLATGDSAPVPTQWTSLGGREPLDAGSVISFCADGPPAIDWSFHLRAAASGQPKGSFGYAVVAPCR